MPNNKIEDFKNARDRMISLSENLLILRSEEYITENTYQYMNDKAIWVLHNIIYPGIEQIENEQI